MCGGIAFKLSKVPKSELARIYGKEKAALLAKRNEAESRFWDERPVLPVIEGGQINLYDWGNRDKNIGLPKTGWAKDESLRAGKWDSLKPQDVTIAAEKGCEKGVWFETPGGISGIKVTEGKEERVYMVTKTASEGYRQKTGHDREPKIISN